jgi:hypothetical protein
LYVRFAELLNAKKKKVLELLYALKIANERKEDDGDLKMEEVTQETEDDRSTGTQQVKEEPLSATEEDHEGEPDLFVSRPRGRK